MAEQGAIRTFLREQMRVGGDAGAENPRTTQLMNNGIDSWASFTEFEDDEVQELIKYIRRPGGDEEGTPIPAAALTRIQIACFAAKYYTTVGRPIEAQVMQWERIKHFKDLIVIQKEHTEPEALSPPTKNSKIVEWTESLEEYLSSVYGVRKIPLSYLIRDEVIPGQIQGLPAGRQLPYSPMYRSFQEELIARATHVHATYATDNEQLYHIISTALKDTPFMASIKRHRGAKNGRGAYLDLVTHHSGTTKWNDLAAESDKKATSLVWNGRSHRYTLMMHINNLRTCHNNLLRANDHIEYAVPTETQRVERLLNSIQTNDPGLVSAKTTIRSSKDPNNGLYTDFERAADFILQVAPKGRQGSRDHNISGVQQDFDDVEKPLSCGPKTGVELRYHSRKEFKALSNEERNELLELRPPKKNNTNNKRNKSRNEDSLNNALRNAKKRFKKHTKKLESRIAALESNRLENNGSENENQNANGNNANGNDRNPLERPTQRN